MAGEIPVSKGFAKPNAFCKSPDNRGSVAITTVRPGRTPGGWMNVAALSEIHDSDDEQSVPPSVAFIWAGVCAKDDPKFLPNTVTIKPPRPGPVVGFKASGDGDETFNSSGL